MKLTINRNQWLRGDKYNSFLLREHDQKMCCLGFLCLQLGAQPDDIVRKGLPRDVRVLRGHSVVEQLDKLLNDDDVISASRNQTAKIVQINDDLEVPENIREQKLTELFAEVGIEVEFVDAPVQHFELPVIQ